MSAASSLGARVALAGAPRAPGKKGLGGRIHAAAVNRRCGRVGFPSPRASIAEPPGSDAPTGEAGETERAKVSMVSLGCPKNTVDGEVMLGDLFANGFDVVRESLLEAALQHQRCGGDALQCQKGYWRCRNSAFSGPEPSFSTIWP